ncbi:putative phytochrome-like histidine kinase [Purpureocillium lavendulum]|uniref:Phytochrome-like histidine kinase n=1 Tax=Purpureocillium lavendulum TaxID=1247861 RepID=A0AB34FKR6_9HYPO|nr:putative phytochrome-like histidine kinase [Purpureocillium lavendulum]
MGHENGHAMENDEVPETRPPPPPAVPSATESGSSDTQDRPTPLATEPASHANDHTEVSSTPTDTQSHNVMSPGPYSSWSTGSELQLGHQSAPSDISDRVFPIRSVVSVGPAHRRGSTSGDDYFPALDTDSRGITAPRTGTQRQEHATELRRSGTLPTSTSPFDRAAHLRRKRAMSGPFSSIQADAARQGTIAPLNLGVSVSDRESEDSGPIGATIASADAPRQSSASVVSGHQSLAELPHVTTRFTHVETEDGHAVITGRDGVLQQCEDEPIHTPGAVQGFGVLLAFREEQDGSFAVRYVSENSENMLGYSPKQLFRLKSFMDILTEEQQDNLLDHIDFIRDEDADPAINGPEVLSLSIRPPKSRKNIKLWCAIHINPAHPDLIICEFELDDDHMYPLRPVDEMTPDAPHDTLHSNPTLEEIEASTEILSKPLRILRSARKRRGEQGAMQVFDIMSQVQEQLASAPNLDTFLKILVGIVKELTGFHRVMIYQFDGSFNGKVVTELVDTSQTLDLYKGLHFPASDIPRQARELYKINKVRLLYDRDLETARIVCRTQEDLENPLDMTHAYLRAMSPIHIKYLANMAVRSSMSISINAFNELWGLIACHSYGPHGMRVSFPIRKMCRLVGDTASRNIERLSYASRLQARKLINTAPTDKNPSGYIIASSDDLLKLFDADFGLLSIKGETKIMGAIEHSQEALAMLEYLRMRKLTSVLTSQDIREDFPDLRYPPGFQVIAGLLYVPLSVGGVDFIVFFRKGQVKEVKWAGNPYEKTIRQGTSGYLEPRTSFKTWRETVIGKCREWNEEQVETAAVLCLVYAMQSSKLTRLLLANSAHEVRTPLNAIINYLEIALEGTLDKETRENLARSHSASKSLIYVINDLLDLTKTEEGQNLIKDEIFDLTACVQEATDPFYIDAKRKGIEYKVTSHPGLPRFVHGDGRRIRQVISNITANAVAHTQSGSVHVDLFVSDVRDGQAIIDIAVADSGAGMNSQQLDTLFRDLEQVSTEEMETGDPTDQSDKPHNTRTLGLGLAIVARIVRNMDGQLRLKSEEGQGSRFVVQLPFLLPDESPGSSNQDASQTSQISNTVASAPDSLKAPPAGEITLIDRGSAVAATGDGERPGGDETSARSRRSVGSYGSHGSHQSDADRLIHAIQTPLSLNEEPSGYFVSRRDSAGSSGRPGSKGSMGATLSTSPQSRKGALVSSQAVDEPGTAEVRDSKTRIRAVKVPEEFKDMPTHPQVGEQSRVLFEVSSDSGQTSGPSKATTRSGSVDGTSLRTLIAEDDPINMKVLRKRLEKAGHEVHHAVNGEDCATVYKDDPSSFDVILMDMQMPIVDGLTSTKMIRGIEKSDQHKGHSPLAATNGRIPIFAVSASLIESQKQTYVDAGFDGWILKPIDFKRLNTLLAGILDTQTRNTCLYLPGEWERGGWFVSRDISEGGSDSQTTPRADETAGKELRDEGSGASNERTSSTT